MNYELRDYQKKGKEQLRDAILTGHKRVIYYAATGSGKGLAMADIAASAISKGHKVLVIMRRRGLVDQTARNFKKYIDVDASILMAGRKDFNPESPLQIASIDSLGRRYEKGTYDFLQHFTLVISDEAHDTTGRMYQAVFEWLGDKIFIGFTATPYRIGNKTHEWWHSYVCPIRPSELRDQGYLCDAKVYAPAAQIDTRGIRKSAGDFNQKQLYQACAAPGIIGDIVEHYKKFAVEKPAICFCVNTAHAKQMAEKFETEGIPAGYSDADTSIERRTEITRQLESGEIKVICNVNTFSTGIDIPIAQVAILARPTHSTVLHVQQVGRVLRPHELKNFAIILDHSGNTFRHGGPFDYREPDLNENASSEKTNDTKMKTCSECFYVFSEGTECPECGYDPSKKAGEESQVLSVDGELRLVNNVEIAKQFAINKFSNELDRLHFLQESRGFKPNFKYFALHKKYGDAIFEYQKELGLPWWLKEIINKQVDTKDTKHS